MTAPWVSIEVSFLFWRGGGVGDVVAVSVTQNIIIGLYILIH